MGVCKIKQRVITGLIGISFFFTFLKLGGLWYSLVLFFLALLAYLEYCRMVNLNFWKLEVITGFFFIFFLFLPSFQNLVFLKEYLKNITNLINFELVFLLYLVFLSFLSVVRNNDFGFRKLSYLFTGTLYIGYGFYFMFLLSLKKHGFLITLFVFTVVWSNDIFAYFFGKKFGKKQLSPKISPKKTWEGFSAGIFLGTLLGYVLFLYFPLFGSSLKGLILSFFISLLGQIGDLVESTWKRTFSIKDSGSMLPGHGGFLDRFDSLLFVHLVIFCFRLF